MQEIGKTIIFLWSVYVFCHFPCFSTCISLCFLVDILLMFCWCFLCLSVFLPPDKFVRWLQERVLLLGLHLQRSHHHHPIYKENKDNKVGSFCQYDNPGMEMMNDDHFHPQCEKNKLVRFPGWYCGSVKKHKALYQDIYWTKVLEW